jgi:hypothetical protein
VLVLNKLWYALLHLNYDREDIKRNMANLHLIPLKVDVYNVSFRLIIKVLRNTFYSTDQFVVYNDQNYTKSYVFFDRFRFDVCSLVSDHIYSGGMRADTYEVVLRQVYKQITF